MTALPVDPRAAARVTWGRAVWAVLAATFLAGVAMIAGLLVLYGIGVAMPDEAGTSGQGWPWRIDGAWSLAADAGPLLAGGAAFAYFAESIATGHRRVPSRRMPIALAAAALGWISVNGTENPGLVSAGGAVSFAGLVIVTREMSRHPRPPWRWTPRRAWSAVALVAVLALATSSYGLLHPLTVGYAEQQSTRDGVARIHTRLSNGGRATVTVLGVSVPSVQVRALTSPADSYEYSPDDPDAGMVPIAGWTIEGGSNSRDLQLVLHCSSTKRVDRVRVRLRVLGRTVEQVLRFPPVAVNCR